MIELSKYILEELRKGKEFNLYRGSSSEDNSQVLLLSPAMEYPRPETLKRLEHEYSLREVLDPAWAARPIEITRHRDRPVLVLEDPGGVPLDQLLGQPLDLAFSLRLAADLSNAIDRLHQCGIIHKDIKPANVLVNSVTGQCWLKGFGIASRLPRERQSAEPPDSVAGTLAYMAPEQTGRMNRSIDSRSDLYALGVSLYEVLTGTLPFTASDPIEWVHCHIARKPVPPEKRSARVPAPVSAIIMKLLAKTAEERYQTAAGVESDLQRCLTDWETRGRISAFPLGEHDIPDQLLIPEKLYGRAREIDTLLASFERVVASGRPELVLVSGYSGIGKSSVVNELHKVLVPSRGLFASGKFDRYKRDIPYSTLAQAFQGLIRPLLGQSDAELSRWRDAFREALVPNAQIIIDLVPELALILGKQPPVPELPPQDAQRRFQLVFRRFIGVFARREHPLVLFVDDLQWLDAATLDLIEDLLSQPDLQHLMLIGAYRDNEVGASHPLKRKFGIIRQAGAAVQEIVLAPLSGEDVELLISDSLRCEREQVSSLAQAVQDKTAGNPFFAIQFLSALAEEELLTFDHSARSWSWNLGRIRGESYTDNIIDLMVGKLSRLSVETQKALQQLACLGNSADIGTLSVVLEKSEGEVHATLWDAVRLEFVIRSERLYKFVHDRIQEAAYSLIPPEERTATHLRIGRLLLTHIPPDHREDKIFEIVNQINRGTALITSKEEREQLAELNLIAGKRAKSAAAYVAALNYFAAGGALLIENHWESSYPLTFALNLAQAECEYLSGKTSTAKERLDMLSRRAATLIDRATTSCLQIELYTSLDQADRAIEVALDFLRGAGTLWSPHPSDADVSQEIQRIWRQLGNRSIEQLVDLQPLADSACSALLDVLTAAHAPANFTDGNLLALIIARMVNLSIRYGNGDGSPLGYVYLGMILESRFGDYHAGFRFGKLGVDLVERAGLDRFKAHAYLNFGNAINPWTRHVRTSLDLLHTALNAANQSGYLTFEAYTYTQLITAYLANGDPLQEVQQFADSALGYVRQTGFGTGVDLILGHLSLIRALRGLTPDLSNFNYADFEEKQFEQHVSTDPGLTMSACWYWIRKLQACFLNGDCRSALSAESNAEKLLWTSPGFLVVADYHFYAALARASQYDAPWKGDLDDLLQKLKAHQKQIQTWAETCPENFQNRYLLLSAEIARIEGRELDAIHLYEDSIRSGHVNGFVHHEALASELAARFYSAGGFETTAQAYLRKARSCYVQWGAAGKVRQLDELYPQLSEELPILASTATIGTSVEHLDLATVVKVSQAVSNEMAFGKLIDIIMRTAIENAGAERGLWIIPRGAQQRVEAEATTSGDTIVVELGASLVDDAALPASIVNYVARTLESVILNDASTENSFSADPYIRRHRARSILCLPLINQANLIGVLYLENNLAPHVFTPRRIAVLKLLASQAAISLENTRLYRDLEEREAKIRRLVEANIMGILIWNFDGDTIEANQAFLDLVQYTRDDLVSGRVRWAALTPVEWRDRDVQAIREAEATGVIHPFEKEYFRQDGSRVPVMVGGALFERGGNEGVAFVLDLSRQKRAEAALQKAQTELAHVARLSTLGELTASITHEINQPLSGLLTNANAGLRWIERDPPNIAEVREVFRRIVRDANRAGDVISRIRALFKKAPATNEPLDLNEAIQEVLALVQAELQRNQVTVRTEFASGLPSVSGDRIQLQQVILNLVVNAIEAMSTIADGPRELGVSSLQVSGAAGGSGKDRIVGSAPTDSACVEVTVRDTGPGLSSSQLEHAFEPYYTTKSQGMGMGLAISRSIIEAHHGHLWARANLPRGAVFQFTLPI